MIATSNRESIWKRRRRSFAEKLGTLLIGRVGLRRIPDRVIGGDDRPYLKRWHLLPRNPICNVYLHLFLRSDDDRALHDHPWINASILLHGTYTEHTIDAGGINRMRVRQAGDIVVRRATGAHRIELHAGSCLTLFITGPRVREWGFHCPFIGWVHWTKFTAADGNTVGKGCDQ